MTVSLILAMSENRVIGRDGGLPWHLPKDLKRFKQLTLGHVLIMGRKTYESIPKRPLPKRRSIVLSRDPDCRPEGVEVARSLEEAFELAGGEDVFVIGGAGVFAATAPSADRLYLTLVHTEIDGDVVLPELDEGSWRLLSDERHEAGKSKSTVRLELVLLATSSTSPFGSGASASPTTRSRTCASRRPATAATVGSPPTRRSSCSRPWTPTPTRCSDGWCVSRF